MGAGVSVTERSSWTKLHAAAKKTHKSSYVVSMIEENEIDVATALELDEEDLVDMAPRKLDQKKLKAALRQLHQCLTRGSANTTSFLTKSFSTSSLQLFPPPTSTASSSTTSFPASSTDVLESMLLDSDDSAAAAATSVQLQEAATPRTSLNILTNLCAVNNTKYLVTTTSATEGVLSSLSEHAVDREEVAESGLWVLLNQCFIRENVLLVRDSVAVVLELLKEWGDHNPKLTEHAASILWLVGAERQAVVAEHKKMERMRTTTVVMATTTHDEDDAQQEENARAMRVIRAILWSIVVHRAVLSVCSSCLLCLSTTLDMENETTMEFMTGSTDGGEECLEILFGVLRSHGTKHLAIAEPGVRVLEIVCRYACLRLSESGEMILNELRMLGGVEYLQQIIVKFPNQQDMRTRAQQSLNMLLEPGGAATRDMITRDYFQEMLNERAASERDPSVREREEEERRRREWREEARRQEEEKTRVAEEKEEEQRKRDRFKFGSASVDTVLLSAVVKKDAEDLFGGLPAWSNSAAAATTTTTTQRQETTIIAPPKSKNKSKGRTEHDMFSDTSWLGGNKRKKRTQAEETDDVLSMFGSSRSGDEDAAAASIDTEVEHIFSLMDVDGSGVVEYKEMLRSLRNVEIVRFISSKPDLAPLLQPRHVRETMKKIIDASDDVQFNLHAFQMFCDAMATMTVDDEAAVLSRSVPSKHTLESVDRLFDLLDLDGNGILTYQECLTSLERPSSSLSGLIGVSDKLEDLLHPKKLRETLGKIARASESRSVTKNSFRLFVASS